MNFLKQTSKLVKSVSTAVGDGVQIGKLDSIVSRRVEQYESLVSDFLENLSQMRSEEESLKAENDFITICLNDYDKEACPYMGRPVNDDWINGGGDNLEVRKRMLNRQLQALRGKLAEAVQTFNTQVNLQLESQQASIQDFEKQLRLKLPCGEAVFTTEYQTFSDKADQQILLTFSGGYIGLNRLCNNALEDSLNAVKNRISQENNILTEKAIQEFRRKMLRQYLTVLRDQVVQTGDRFKSTVLTEDDVKTDLITPAVILELHKQVDALTQMCLADIDDNGVKAISV
jgi:hypothetical protein